MNMNIISENSNKTDINTDGANVQDMMTLLV